MVINAIKKGKGFEREVAHYLTKQLGVKFERVPCSGGFQTSHDTRDHRFRGDVFTECDLWKDLTVECKRHKDLRIIDLFNKKSKFWEWIEQCKTESASSGVEGKWVLFFRMNNMPLMACSPRTDVLTHEEYFIPLEFLRTNKKIVLQDDKEKYEVVVCPQ